MVTRGKSILHSRERFFLSYLWRSFIHLMAIHLTLVKAKQQNKNMFNLTKKVTSSTDLLFVVCVEIDKTFWIYKVDVDFSICNMCILCAKSVLVLCLNNYFAHLSKILYWIENGTKRAAGIFVGSSLINEKK